MKVENFKAHIEIQEIIKLRSDDFKLIVRAYCLPNELQFFSNVKSLLTLIVPGSDLEGVKIVGYLNEPRLNNPNYESQNLPNSKFEIKIQDSLSIDNILRLMSFISPKYTYDELLKDFETKGKIEYLLVIDCKAIFERLKEEGEFQNYLYQNIYAIYNDLIPTLQRIKPEIKTKEDVDEYFKTLFKDRLKFDLSSKRRMTVKQLESYRDEVLRFYFSTKPAFLKEKK